MNYRRRESSSFIKPMSYKSRKSLVSLNEAAQVVAIQRNLNPFEFCGENDFVSLVPHGQSSRSNTSP